MKKTSIIFFLLLLFLVSGCAKTEKGESYISDPFSNFSSEPVEDTNSTRDKVMLLSQGGFSCKVNNGESVEYNGNPITVPVKVSASDECKTDISVGVMCFINGTIQWLSSDGETDKAIIIKTDIAPGETKEFDVTFTPVVSQEDANKEQLDITFLSLYNPDYTPTEEFVSFGYTHDIGWVPSKYIKFNSKPDVISQDVYNSYDESILAADSGSNTGIIQNGSYAGVLRMNTDNTLSFSAHFENYNSGEYVGYILKNNEPAKFNNGEDCINISVKKMYEYNINIELKNVKKGDVLHCFFVKKDGCDTFNVINLSPCLITENGFTFSNSSTSISSSESPNPPAVEKPIGDIIGISASYYVPRGYIGTEPVRAVIQYSDDRLIMYDMKNNKILNELAISEQSEISGETIQMRWDEIQVLKDCICVPKLIIKDRNVIFEGVSLYDADLNFINDIAVVADCLTFDAQNGIKALYDNYLESKSQTLYMSDIENEDIRSRKLCDIPEKYQIVRSSLVTDEKFLYGLLTENNGNSDLARAFAVDLLTGEFITNPNGYIYSPNGGIYTTKYYTLYATGKRDPKSSYGGTLVYFDKKNSQFREIQTLSVNECLYAGITPDGSKIVACASVFRSIDKSNNESIRVYSTTDGSLLAETEGSSNKFPVCANDSYIVADGEQFKKITFAEMGLT